MSGDAVHPANGSAAARLSFESGTPSQSALVCSAWFLQLQTAGEGEAAAAAAAAESPASAAPAAADEPAAEDADAADASSDDNADEEEDGHVPIPDLPAHDPCIPLCEFKGGWRTLPCQECIMRGEP